MESRRRVVVTNEDAALLVIYDADSCELTHECSVSKGPYRLAFLSETEFVLTRSKGDFSLEILDVEVLSGAVPPGGISKFRRTIMSQRFDSRVLGLETIPAVPGVSGQSGLIIAGDCQSHVDVYNVEKEAVVSELRSAPPITRSIEFVREWGGGEVFVGGGYGYVPDSYNYFNIRQYDLSKSVLLKQLPGHNQTVFDLEIDVLNGRFFSGSNSVKVWSRDTLECVDTFSLQKSTSSCYSIAYASDLHLVVCGMTGGLAEIWDDRNTARSLRRVELCGGYSLNQLARIDTRTFVSCSNCVSWWNVDGKIKKEHNVQLGWCYGMCTMGSPYDRPACLVLAQHGRIDDFGGRIAVLTAASPSSVLVRETHGFGQRKGLHVPYVLLDPILDRIAFDED